MTIKKINFLIGLLLTAILFNSCSTNNSSGGGASPIPISIFRLNINGQNFEWVGSLFDNTTKGSKLERSSHHNCSGVTVNTFEMSAKDYTSFTNDCSIGFFTGTTNLQPSTTYQSTEYTNTASNTCSITLAEFHISQNSSLSGCSYPDLGDLFSVTVSSVSNGYASGTFSGQIRNSRSSSPMQVSGEFINVKYIQ